MADAINVGDVVQLKSGGPRMTVSSIDGRDVYCEWFAATKRETGVFQVETLNKIESR
jgi:uncharacterized protein YodC (DUF2158 family)